VSKLKLNYKKLKIFLFINSIEISMEKLSLTIKAPNVEVKYSTHVPMYRQRINRLKKNISFSDVVQTQYYDDYRSVNFSPRYPVVKRIGYYSPQVLSTKKEKPVNFTP